jgi:hypothetical protein
MFTNEANAQSAVVDGNAAMAAQENSASSGNQIATSNGTNGLLQEGGSSATSNSTGYLDNEGKFTEGWLDRLKGFEDSKQILGQFKDIDGVFKTLVSQQRLLGKKADAVILPNEKSSPEEWKEFNKRIGIPETSDPYHAIKPANLSDNSEWTNETSKAFGDIAHKAGVTPQQWQKIIDQMNAYGEKGEELERQASEQEIENNRKALAEEWGDKFDINISKAKRLVQLGGGDLDDPALRSAGMVKMLARIADTLSDDKLVSSDSAATMMVGKTRAFDIMKNPDNPLHKRYTSGDKEIAALVTDLLK